MRSEPTWNGSRKLMPHMKIETFSGRGKGRAVRSRAFVRIPVNPSADVALSTNTFVDR